MVKCLLYIVSVLQVGLLLMKYWLFFCFVLNTNVCDECESSRSETYKFTLCPPSTTKVPYTNSLNQDGTTSNSVSHPDPSRLTPRQHFSPTLSDVEALWILKQTRNPADNNSFCRLRVKSISTGEQKSRVCGNQT